MRWLLANGGVDEGNEAGETKVRSGQRVCWGSLVPGPDSLGFLRLLGFLCEQPAGVSAGCCNAAIALDIVVKIDWYPAGATVNESPLAGAPSTLTCSPSNAIVAGAV